MINTAHNDNSEIPKTDYTSPFENYVRSNYKNANIPTTDTMIDLKGPVCYIWGTTPKTDELSTLTRQQIAEARLADTVNERMTKEEGVFVGHHFDD